MNHSEVIVALLLHNFVIYRIHIFKIYFSSTLYFVFSHFELCFTLFGNTYLLGNKSHFHLRSHFHLILVNAGIVPSLFPL